MEAGTTFRFARVARTLSDATRAAGFTPPAFRSPPRRDGVERAIRRCPSGTIVAVRLGERPFDAAVADMVEGVVTACVLEGGDAYRLRSRLWDALADDACASTEESPGDPVRADGSDCDEARVAERQTQAA